MKIRRDQVGGPWWRAPSPRHPLPLALTVFLFSHPPTPQLDQPNDAGAHARPVHSRVLQAARPLGHRGPSDSLYTMVQPQRLRAPAQRWRNDAVAHPAKGAPEARGANPCRGPTDTESGAKGSMRQAAGCGPGPRRRRRPTFHPPAPLLSFHCSSPSPGRRASSQAGKTSRGHLNEHGRRHALEQITLTGASKTHPRCLFALAQCTRRYKKTLCALPQSEASSGRSSTSHS